MNFVFLKSGSFVCSCFNFLWWWCHWNTNCTLGPFTSYTTIRPQWRLHAAALCRSSWSSSWLMITAVLLIIAWTGCFLPIAPLFCFLLRHCHASPSSPGDITDLPGKNLLSSPISHPFTHMFMLSLPWTCLTSRCCSLLVCRGRSVRWVSAVRILLRSGLVLVLARPPSETMSTLMRIHMKTPVCLHSH